jgi:hypothetical protein
MAGVFATRGGGKYERRCRFSLNAAFMSVEFEGFFTAPPFSGSERVSVFAPFSFGGSVFFPERFGFENPSRGIGAHGHCASESVVERVYGIVAFARYEFETASAVPEPTTLLLVASAAL